MNGWDWSERYGVVPAPEEDGKDDVEGYGGGDVGGDCAEDEGPCGSP